MSTRVIGADPSTRGQASTLTRRSILVQFRYSFLSTALLSICACVPPRGTIGAVLLRKKTRRVFVQDVPPHLAAARAGVQPGDELLTISGQDVRRLSDDDLRRALSGEVGEPVDLTFVRGDEVLRVTVKRSMAEAYRVQ